MDERENTQKQKNLSSLRKDKKMEEMVRRAVENQLGAEIESLVEERMKKIVEEKVTDWYIEHNLKDYVEDTVDGEMNNLDYEIENEIDAYIAGAMRNWA